MEKGLNRSQNEEARDFGRKEASPPTKGGSDAGFGKRAWNKEAEIIDLIYRAELESKEIDLQIKMESVLASNISSLFLLNQIAHSGVGFRF